MPAESPSMAARVRQSADMQGRDQGLAGHANTTKQWEPACFIMLGLTGTCPRSSHLSRKSYPIYHFFSFAFTLLFIPTISTLTYKTL